MELTLVKIPDVVPEKWIDPRMDSSFWQTDCTNFLAKNPAEHEKLAAQLIVHDWAIALHWLYQKKCDSKHKIPGSRKARKSLEPFGEVLRALVELAVQSHACGCKYSRFYPNAGTWFQAVAQEAYPFCFNGRASKTEVVADLRKALKLMKDRENPFDPRRFPHLAGLVECALEISGKSDRFHNEYWRGLKGLKPNDGRSRGLIYSLSALVTEAEKNPDLASVRISETSAIARVGSGQRTTKIWSLKKGSSETLDR